MRETRYHLSTRLAFTAVLEYTALFLYCLPKLLTPLYTPKLYNNDNYESLDILVYEY